MGKGGAGGICLLHIFPPFPYLVLSRQRLLLYKHKIYSGGEVSGSLTVYKGRCVCVCVCVCICVCAVCLPEKESHLICGVNRDMRQFVRCIQDTAYAASTICSVSRFHQARGVSSRRLHHQKRETGREREKSEAELVHWCLCVRVFECVCVGLPAVHCSLVTLASCCCCTSFILSASDTMIFCNHLGEYKKDELLEAARWVPFLVSFPTLPWFLVLFP